MGFQLSPARAKRRAQTRHQEEKNWQLQNGPLLVSKLTDPPTQARVIPFRDTAPTCACGSLRTYHTGTTRHRPWFGWFCTHNKCQPVWMHNQR